MNTEHTDHLAKAIEIEVSKGAELGYTMARSTQIGSALLIADGNPTAWSEEYASLAFKFVYETIIAASEQTMGMTITTDLRLKAAASAHKAMLERIEALIVKRANKRAEIPGAVLHN